MLKQYKTKDSLESKDLFHSIFNTRVKAKINEIQKLKCMYSNLRSIKNCQKRDELLSLLLEQNIDILGIFESWVHEDISDAEINFEGYSLFRKDRVIGDKTKVVEFCCMLRIAIQ